MASTQAPSLGVKTLAEVMDPEDGILIKFGTFRCSSCPLWHWGSFKPLRREYARYVEIEPRGNFTYEADATADCLIFVFEFSKTRGLLVQFNKPVEGR